MAVNRTTGKIEMLTGYQHGESGSLFARRLESMVLGQFGLLRPNGEPVPRHWPVFAVDELVVVKGCTMRVAHINESGVLFEPVSMVIDAPREEGH